MNRLLIMIFKNVLGDNGKLYTNFDEQMIMEMRHLIRKADVITPNMTELFYLAQTIQPIVIQCDLPQTMNKLAKQVGEINWELEEIRKASLRCM